MDGHGLPPNCPYSYEITDSATAAQGLPHEKMKSEPDIANKRETDSEAIATLAGTTLASKQRSCRYRERRRHLAIIANRSLFTQKRPFAALPRNDAKGHERPPAPQKSSVFGLLSAVRLGPAVVRPAKIIGGRRGRARA
jgi:hypothetical protein